MPSPNGLQWIGAALAGVTGIVMLVAFLVVTHEIQTSGEGGGTAFATVLSTYR